MKLALAVLVACSSPAPKPVAPPAAPAVVAPAFTPTAFGVAVAGEGRPVILIPGLACPASVWDTTIAHLGAHVQTHVLTLSGFAGRPPIDGPLIATAREELAHYIRDRKLDHPVVIGHSLGGTLALWLAATEPDLVGPVIAADAVPSSGEVPPFAAATRDSWKAATPEQFAAGARQFFAAMTNDPPKLEPVMQGILKSDQRAVADAFYELFTINLEVGKIKAPVLAILAEGPYRQMIEDRIAAIPTHESVVLPHAKHMLMQDDPDGFFHAVDTFLAARVRL